MIRKYSRVGNSDLPEQYDEANENPLLIEEGPGGVSALFTALEDKKDEDFIKSVIPAFKRPRYQNIVNRTENEEYIEPNSNTNVRDKVRFEVEFNVPYSFADSVLRLYIKIENATGQTALVKAATGNNTHRVALSSFFNTSIIKEIKVIPYGGTDPINNNCEVTGWKNLPFRLRKRHKNASRFSEMTLDTGPTLDVSKNSNSRSRRTIPTSSVVTKAWFTERKKFTQAILDTDDDGYILDIALGEIDNFFQSEMVFQPSIKLGIEVFFHKNKYLLETNIPVAIANGTEDTELYKINFIKNPQLFIPQYFLTHQYGETIQAGFEKLSHATIQNGIDAKLVVHSMNENVSHFSAQVAITEQPMYILVGITRDSNYTHETHWDNLYMLESLAIVKKITLKNVYVNNVVKTLEYDYRKNEHKRRLWNEYKSFLLDVPSTSPINNIMKEIGDFEIPTYTDYISENSTTSFFAFDLTPDKGATNMSSIPVSAGNLQIDLDFKDALAAESRLLVWCVYNNNYEMRRHGGKYPITYNPSGMKMNS